MLISHHYRYIFIAVPKTATTSIIRALKEHGDAEVIKPKHKSASEARIDLPPKIWDEYYKFAFVRNPYDWMASWYFYRCRKSIKDNANKHQKFTENASFSDFVRFDSEWPRTQAEFLVDNNGEWLIDFVGRYEYLQHDFEAVCEHLKIPKTNLPSLNISTNEVNPNKLYNDELIAIVKKRDGEIIKRFGYQPNYTPNKLKGRSLLEYIYSKSRSFASNLIRPS